MTTTTRIPGRVFLHECPSMDSQAQDGVSTAKCERTSWTRVCGKITVQGFLLLCNRWGYMTEMLGAHVDDLIYGSKPGYEHLVDKVLEIFSVRKTEQLHFRFCGREWVQDPVTFDITITCQDTTENIDFIEFSSRNRALTAKAGDGEVAQLRSFSGSVSWVARQSRPDQSYHAPR